jgi:hypothetical protein
MQTDRQTSITIFSAKMIFYATISIECSLMVNPYCWALSQHDRVGIYWDAKESIGVAAQVAAIMESRLPVELVCVDLEINKVVKNILFPQDVALPSTYLNDVRFDLRHGKGKSRSSPIRHNKDRMALSLSIWNQVKAGVGSTTIHQPRLKTFKTFFR